MKTRIKSALIVPMTFPGKYFHGAVEIEGSEIVYVGEKGREDFVPDREIDGRGRILLPGLVNAHTHIAMTHLRGWGDDLPLERWLNEKVFPVEDRMTEEDVYWGAQLGMLEMLRTGTTAFIDQYFFEEGVARALRESGMRAALSRDLCVIGDSEVFSENRRAKEAEALYKNWHGAEDGRIEICYSVHSVYLCTPPFIAAAAEEAKRKGIALRFHMSETKTEVENCLKAYGKTPVGVMADAGALSQNASGAHCVHLTKEDMDLMAASGVTAVHNPVSNLKLASGIAPVFEMQKKNINIALGTDGVSSNNNLNMLEEVRLAALLGKGVTLDAAAVPAYEALKMATANGYKTLGVNGGTIEPGKKADLILIDTDTPQAMPLFDPISAAVYALSGNDVSLTMVDGQVLYEDGEYMTLDKEKIFAEGARCAERLYPQ